MKLQEGEIREVKGVSMKEVKRVKGMGGGGE
jgi:hypothetical protein